MRAIDSSVAVAGLLGWHEAHEETRPHMRNASIPVHALTETYAVLTRLPRPLTAADAGELLDRAFDRDRILVPSARLRREVIRRCAALDITGGAVHDAVIALTAKEHGAVVVTRERRAAAVYEAVGVEVVWT